MIAIAQFGPKAALAAPVLVEALNDPQLRQNTVTALRNIGPTAAPAVIKRLAG